MAKRKCKCGKDLDFENAEIEHYEMDGKQTICLGLECPSCKSEYRCYVDQDDFTAIDKECSWNVHAQ